MRSPLLYVIFAWTLIGGPQSAWARGAAPSDCSVLDHIRVLIRNEVPFEDAQALRLGQRAILELPQEMGALEALYVGTVVDSASGSKDLIFAEATDEGVLHFVKESSAHFEHPNARFKSTENSLLVQARMQAGGTCWAHANWNCVRQMRIDGALTDLAQLIGTPAADDELLESIRTLVYAGDSSNGYRNLREFYERGGIKIEELSSEEDPGYIERIESHLKAGNYAVFDYAVDPDTGKSLGQSTQVSYVGGNRVAKRVPYHKPSMEFTRIERHAAFAARLIPWPDGTNKVLIMDSARGAPHLWDLTRFERTRRPHLKVMLIHREAR